MDAFALARPAVDDHHLLPLPLRPHHDRDERPRHRNPSDLRLAKFLGKLFTINFALGLVTGIVQEFQFGMNGRTTRGSSGDIFGPTLVGEDAYDRVLDLSPVRAWLS